MREELYPKVKIRIKFKVNPKIKEIENEDKVLQLHR